MVLTTNSSALWITGLSAMAQVLILQLDERVVAILRELLTAAARQGGVVQQRLAELRQQTPALGRGMAVDGLIREGRSMAALRLASWVRAAWLTQ